MYSTLAMLKPDATFSLFDVEGLIASPCELAAQRVTRTERRIKVEGRDGALHIVLEDGPNVRAEAEELANRHGLACKGTTRRLAIYADDDPEAELFDLFQILIEKLEGTDKFVVHELGGERALSVA